MVRNGNWIFENTQRGPLFFTWLRRFVSDVSPTFAGYSNYEFDPWTAEVQKAVDRWWWRWVNPCESQDCFSPWRAVGGICFWHFLTWKTWTIFFETLPTFHLSVDSLSAKIAQFWAGDTSLRRHQESTTLHHRPFEAAPWFLAAVCGCGIVQHLFDIDPKPFSMNQLCKIP